MVRIVSIDVRPLSVPLREPFVIASGRIDVTRAALVRVTAERHGREATGYGEAAALPPVTREDRDDFLQVLPEAGASIRGAVVHAPEDVPALLDPHLASTPAARAGLECALLDVMARLEGVPLRRLLAPDRRPESTLTTDITIPIGPAERMGVLARQWRAQGFECFKVKVGSGGQADRDGLAAIHAAAPDARIRLDANEGLSAAEALALLEDCEALGVAVELFEQPCRKDDLHGMAQVAAASAIPVIADESVATATDLGHVVDARAADGVNLKLAKSGGLLSALSIGGQARRAGLSVMVGGMVETRLGMSAMAQVAGALGGVRYVDLDTAWLLADDPFVGGYRERGPRYELLDAPGLGLELRSPKMLERR